jgi:integral membrane protein
MSPLHLLRNTGKIEAISFLFLILIAMPLKYAANLPEAVKIVGWIHGVLFILFCLALGNAQLKTSLSPGMAILVFIAALLPFGPFLIDSYLKRYDEKT